MTTTVKTNRTAHTPPGEATTRPTRASNSDIGSKEPAPPRAEVTDNADGNTLDRTTTDASRAQ
ncbi:hypothetical protein [Kitasatospora sp. NPDC004531]